ncbi:MAG TPA: FMN-binding protein [Methylomirabilota bacterium]|nr:FMN-binding protein [Methylomirabilota bacterium]
MKKMGFSFLVIFVFIFYVLHERSEQSEVHIVNQTTPSSSPAQNPQPTTSQKSAKYQDGEYIGDVKDAFYGNMQVKATIQNGRITYVQFLQYPNDRQTSIEINQQAIPILKSEAIQAQSAQVDIVSGATDSSQAFKDSLASALAKAS